MTRQILFYERPCSISTYLKRCSRMLAKYCLAWIWTLLRFLIRTNRRLKYSSNALVWSAINSFTNWSKQAISGFFVDSLLFECCLFLLEAFLADDETVDAEVFLNKASSCIQTVTDVALLLRYRATYARVLDANRKFVEAAMRYYDLSNTTYADVSSTCSRVIDKAYQLNTSASHNRGPTT